MNIGQFLEDYCRVKKDPDETLGLNSYIEEHTLDNLHNNLIKELEIAGVLELNLDTEKEKTLKSIYDTYIDLEDAEIAKIQVLVLLNIRIGDEEIQKLNSISDNDIRKELNLINKPKP